MITYNFLEKNGDTSLLNDSDQYAGNKNQERPFA